MKTKARSVVVRSPHEIQVFDGDNYHTIRVNEPIYIEPLPKSEIVKGGRFDCQSLFSPKGAGVLIEHLKRK